MGIIAARAVIARVRVDTFISYPAISDQIVKAHYRVVVSVEAGRIQGGFSLSGGQAASGP
jgi:hypothetical protein